MANVWHVFQACGWPSWWCLLFGILAIGVSLVALLIAVLRLRVAVVLAWVALVFALAPVAIGIAGMSLGRSKVERALLGDSIDAELRERIRREGYAEAAGCVEIGGWLSAPPVLLAGLGVGLAYALQASSRGAARKRSH